MNKNIRNKCREKERKINKRLKRTQADCEVSNKSKQNRLKTQKELTLRAAKILKNADSIQYPDK